MTLLWELISSCSSLREALVNLQVKLNSTRRSNLTIRSNRIMRKRLPQRNKYPNSLKLMNALRNDVTMEINLLLFVIARSLVNLQVKLNSRRRSNLTIRTRNMRKRLPQRNKYPDRMKLMNALRNDVTMEINLLLFVFARSVVNLQVKLNSTRRSNLTIRRMNKMERLPRRKGVFY